MQRHIAPGQAVPQAGRHRAEAGDPRHHHGLTAPLPQQVRQITAGGIQRDVPQVRHGHAAPGLQLGLYLVRRPAVGLLPLVRIALHGEMQREQLLALQRDHLADNVQGQRPPGTGAGCGNDRALRQNPNRLSGEQLRISGPDPYGVKNSLSLFHIDKISLACFVTPNRPYWLENMVAPT